MRSRFAFSTTWKFFFGNCSSLDWRNPNGDVTDTPLHCVERKKKKSSLTLTLENQKTGRCVCVCVSIVGNFLIEKFWGTNFYGTGGLRTCKTYVSFFLSPSMISTWPDIPIRPIKHQPNERYPNSSRYVYIMKEDRALSWRLSWRSVIKLRSPKGF